MPDIDITCPQCKTVNTVSEFVDPDNILCRTCKTKLEKPAEAGKIKKKPTVRARAVHTIFKQPDDLDKPPRRERQATHPAQLAVEQASKANKAQKSEPQNTVRATTKIKQQPRKFQMTDVARSWLIFFCLGSVTGYLRYGGILTEDNIENFDSIAPFIYLGVHIFLCVQVAKESIIHGILGFLLPPYMLYYLFAVSDYFYMRAIVAGLAVGMSQATAVFIADSAAGFFSAADAWLHDPYHAN